MKKITALFLFCSVFAFAFGGGTVPTVNEPKNIVFVYGNSIHYWGDHENRLMSEILASLVNENTPCTAKAVDASDPEIENKLMAADAVIIISEGEAHHPFKGGKIKILEGVKNLGAFHYALDFGSKSESDVLGAKIGGFFEQNWSVNPSFLGKFEIAESNTIASGVKSFELYDEWYFNMRFNDGGGKISALMKANPPDAVRKKSFGPHSGNQFVRENLGRSETIFWSYERNDGGRGIGFTGGHSIFNLYEDNLRKLIINSAVWLAGGKIPENGYNSKMPPIDEIASRITKEKRPDYESYMERWKKQLCL